MSESPQASRTGMQRALDAIERIGNKVPHPVAIFLLLIAAVIALSHVFYLLGTTVTFQVVNPVTHAIEDATAGVNSLATADGLRFMLTSVVPNFLAFTAVSVVIVAMVGVGLAEEAGLIKALIRKLVLVAPPKALTWILVAVGIMSSVASDAGYLVLIPLAAVASVALLTVVIALVSDHGAARGVDGSAHRVPRAGHSVRAGLTPRRRDALPLGDRDVPLVDAANRARQLPPALRDTKINH